MDTSVTEDGKMDRVVKARWLEALRSGRYQQTHKWLRTPDGFCCLGVLCDLRDPNAWRESGFHDNQGRMVYYKHLEGAETDLPDGTLKWAGMPVYSGFSVNGLVALPGEQEFDFEGEAVTEVLMAMNDAGKSFAEIADWIEVHL